jgi:hypothetical protein
MVFHRLGHAKTESHVVGPENGITLEQLLYVEIHTLLHTELLVQLFSNWNFRG